MTKTCIWFAAAALLPTLVFAADYNFGQLARSNKMEMFNRKLDQTRAGPPEVVFLNSADDYGLAWITGVEFSKGTIEIEIKGRNEPGQSFVGIAFHGEATKHSMRSICDPLISKPSNPGTGATPFNTFPCPSTTGVICVRIIPANMKPS